jgi:hypothetical protein
MAITTQPDIASTSLAQINSQLQMYLQQESVLINTVWQQFPVAGAESIKLPTMGGFTVNDKVAGVSASDQTVTTGGDVLNLDKEKVVMFAIEDKAREQSVVDLAGQALQRAARDMAYQIDLDIFAQLKLASAAAPDHKLAFANASTLGKADILEAKKLLEQQHLRFNECYIAVNALHHSELLSINEFISADYVSGAPIVTGQVGTLYGARVIQTEAVADNEVMVYHPEHCAYAIQRNMRIESDRDIAALADRYAVHASYGVKVLAGGVKAVLLGTAI